EAAEGHPGCHGPEHRARGEAPARSSGSRAGRTGPGRASGSRHCLRPCARRRLRGRGPGLHRPGRHLRGELGAARPERGRRAVETSGDPSGTYYRYSFQYGNFPDYPKIGVWPDAYYVTFNMFKGGVTFAGPEVCAYDRSKMLAGQAATQQCYLLSTSYGSLLPSDLDGATAPPT